MSSENDFLLLFSEFCTIQEKLWSELKDALAGEESSLPVVKEENSPTQASLGSEAPKKRRGRPKKVKPEEPQPEEPQPKEE